MALQTVSLLHLSDTHNLQDELQDLPAADILLHTGDLTNDGTRSELEAVNVFFGAIKDRYKHMLVIVGNHDVHGEEEIDDYGALLSNVTLLNHEVAEEVEKQYGLRIFGSPFLRPQRAANPAVDRMTKARAGHLFHLIPEGVDILLTHGPPRDIFDVSGFRWKEDADGCMQLKLGQWGSCIELNQEIMRACPRAHLFGHLHEQRGYWLRGADGSWLGGVEYLMLAEEGSPAEAFPTKGPPPADWPCHFVCCNAMQNHPGHEHISTKRISGRPRLIFARRTVGELWQFGVE